MIRVLVVDDHPVVRHGLVSMLRWESDLEIVGEAADGEAAIDEILATEPDVVLLDLEAAAMDEDLWAAVAAGADGDRDAAPPRQRRQQSLGQGPGRPGRRLCQGRSAQEVAAPAEHAALRR